MSIDNQQSLNASDNYNVSYVSEMLRSLCFNRGDDGVFDNFNLSQWIVRIDIVVTPPLLPWILDNAKTISTSILTARAFSFN